MSATERQPHVMPRIISASQDAIFEQIEVVDPIQDARWDAWVAERKEATVFHTSAWARVLAETYGYRPSYFTGVNRHSTRFLAPVFEVDSWMTGRRGICLPFSDFCHSLPDGDAGLPKPLFDAVAHLAATRRWRYIELRGQVPQLSGAIASQSYYRHELRLDRTEQQVFDSFHPSVRRAIRKAEKSRLTVEVTRAPEAIDDYFRLQGYTRRRHGLAPQPIKFFRKIHEHIIQRGLGFTVVARHAGRAIASAIFFHLGSQALFKFGASDERFQEFRPTNLVLWTAMCECLSRGIDRFSLGRNAIQHESLRRFKLSWGAEESMVHYSKFDCASKSFVQDRSLLTGWQNHVFRHMPLTMSRIVGAFLYRHIA